MGRLMIFVAGFVTFPLVAFFCRLVYPYFCKVVGHDWDPAGWHGEDQRLYACTRCGVTELRPFKLPKTQWTFRVTIPRSDDNGQESRPGGHPDSVGGDAS